MNLSEMGLQDFIVLGLIGAPFFIIVLGAPLLMSVIAIQWLWWIFGSFIYIPKKKNFFERMYEMREEYSATYGFNRLMFSYSARDLFPRIPDLNKFNAVRTEVLGLKPITFAEENRLALLKQLYEASLVMLYRREFLKRQKPSQWSEEKETRWKEICPRYCERGLDIHYYDYLKQQGEFLAWEEKPVQAHA